MMCLINKVDESGEMKAHLREILEEQQHQAHPRQTAEEDRQMERQVTSTVQISLK